MKSSIRILALGTSLVFLVYSAWRILLHGILEIPSFEAPHLEAGAGGLGLLCQGFLAVLSTLACVIWCFIEGNRRLRLSAVVLAASAPWILYVTARGLQRFAPGFSEEAFSDLEALHNSGHPLQISDVVAKIGEPLIAYQASDDSKGQVRWLYSYMPSCGFGWDKKYVWSDSEGLVTHIYTMEEP
jgi:hypothetical protein